MPQVAPIADSRLLLWREVWSHLVGECQRRASGNHITASSSSRFAQVGAAQSGRYALGVSSPEAQTSRANN